MRRPTYFSVVDAIKQHGQRRAVQGYRRFTLGGLRQLESPALQTLVPKNKAAVIPRKNFDAVATSGCKGEIEMASVNIHAHFCDDASQFIKAGSHIDGLGSNENTDAARQRQHQTASPSASAK